MPKWSESSDYKNYRLNKIFRKSSLALSRFNPYYSYKVELIRSLEGFEIDLRIDIVANKNLFAKVLDGRGFKANIIMQNFIKKIFNLFGLNLTRINVRNVPSFQIVQALKVNNINIVFDVGANLGQFALELRKYGYDGKIVSFEPLSQAYEKLVKLAEKDEKWFVHPRCALGASDAEIEINVAANLASSSILPMLAKHENAAPHAKYTHKDKATLIKLDSVFENYASLEENIFIKIDTQGYEWAVLDGAEKALKQSKGVLLELSLTPLYEGQKLWLDLVNRLERAQYAIYAIQPGFTDKETGETLQVDGLFFKAIT